MGALTEIWAHKHMKGYLLIADSKLVEWCIRCGKWITKDRLLCDKCKKLWK